MLKIDKDSCIGCGVCEDTCTFSAIKVEDGVAVVGDNCTLCGNCVDVCEVGALALDKVEKKVSTNLKDWSGVWVYAEFRDGRIAPVAYELLGSGRKLADQLGVPLSAVLLGSKLGDKAQDLVAYGADKVYRVDAPELEHFTDDAYANVFEDLILAHKPEIVIAGATAIGRSFIPRLATMLATGLTADCTELAIRDEDGALLQTRPAFGGNIMATIECPSTRPQMATVRPLVMKPNVRDDGRKGEIVNVCPEPARLQSRVTVLRSIREESDEININEADVLVAGGRGLESAKGFEMVRELAALFGGATAASRAAVDSGWISYPHQVGQTGKTVCPKIYFACGISGAIQHMVGMQSSDTIIAINRDENAPIFNVATYGLVGDVLEILPKLIIGIKERRAGGAGI